MDDTVGQTGFRKGAHTSGLYDLLWILVTGPPFLCVLEQARLSVGSRKVATCGRAKSCKPQAVGLPPFCCKFKPS